MLRRWRLAGGALALWGGLGALLAWIPPVASPGYLQALVLNVALLGMVPPVLMALGALATERVWPLPVVAAAGALLAGLPAVVSAVWAWWAGTLCSPGAGLVHTVLGPVMSGALLGALVTLSCAAARRTGWRWGVLLGAMAVIIGPSLWTLYVEPQAFSLNALYGHFRGPLYDEGQPPMDRVHALRLQSASLVLLVLGAAAALDGKRGPLARRWGVLTVLTGVPLHAVVLHLTDALVHPGRAGVLSELSMQTVTPRVVLHSAPGRMSPAMAQRVAWESDRHVGELRAELGLPEGPPVQVVLYPSGEDKLRLIGASGTLLARPWQHEIHVQGTALPIPALRHEMAHVVLGELVDGPFDVPAWGGVVPNVLMVEGMATALEDPRGELTLMQRAAVMKRMQKLPRVATLLAPWGFWLESGARAYTAAGAFLRFAGARGGPGALARIYRDGLGAVDVAALEAAWWEHLDALEVPEQSTGGARRAFRRGGLGERLCTDDAADLWDSAGTLAGRGELDEAEVVYRRLLELDAGNDGPLLALLDASAGRGDTERTARVAGELLDTEPDPETRSRVLQSRGEALVRGAELEEARVLLADALAAAQSEGRRRSLVMVNHAVERVLLEGPRNACGRGALAVLRFLLGQGPERARGRSDLMVLERARSEVAGAACDRDGSVAGHLVYLMGRQLVGDDPVRALALLADAHATGLEPLVLRRENLRLMGEAAENAGQHGRAAQRYQELLQLAATDGEREEATALRARATYAELHTGRGEAPRP
jgi:hypothetical protein